MRFKKIYIEITNNCNLNCKFCIGNQRKNKFMKKEEFIHILNQIKPYTKYIYLHILGEPLMHPNINEFIEIATKKGFKVNITTNGYLINRIKNKNIRQLNISLHSFKKEYKKEISKYLDDIFAKIEELSNTYISLRLWVKNSEEKEILKYIEKKYKIKIDKINNIKLTKNIYLNEFKEFIWPDLKNDYYNETGRCYGLIDHIGILVDGTIVPCCLDSSANIKLGNIYESNLHEILKTNRVENIIKNFKNNKKIEELCKHCKFLD